jgi:hypothetical protein
MWIGATLIMLFRAGKEALVWHRRSRTERAPDSCDVWSEAEAFLRGTYAEHLESRGRRVPSWVWLNRVAHGTETDLSALVRGDHSWDGSTSGNTGWYRMVSFLAADLLALARATDQTVSALQREVLVPLELELAREDNHRRLGAAQLVSVALAALHGHPSTSG